jgi:AcrR family transcriptional regulator
MRARGEKTRRRLLDAASAVFAKRGYHAARVDDIVKVARTSHGTFYLYFENKEDLFAALAGEVTEQMSVLVSEFPTFGPDAVGKAELEAWLERFAAHYRMFGPVLRAWTEAEIAGDAVSGIGAAASAQFVEAFTKRFRSTPGAGMDPSAAALAVVAMIERTHYYLLTDQIDIDSAAMTATLARVTHAAVHG